MRDHFVIDGGPFPIISHGRRDKGALLGLFIKSLIPFVRSPCSWPNHFPKAPPPSAITLEVRFQHMKSKEHKHSGYSTAWQILLHFRWKLVWSSEFRGAFSSVSSISYATREHLTSIPDTKPTSLSQGDPLWRPHPSALGQLYLGTPSSSGWTHICSSVPCSDLHSSLRCYTKQIYPHPFSIKDFSSTNSIVFVHSFLSSHALDFPFLSPTITHF